ncbi:hypothetical protein SERLA73DRAFT_70442 [Serpula lacrymans var. lacrymans S7.3]|uniref:Integrase zinc-binding domain-containing protein n=2 Tax=Serpula lacrymans var. lacrymans TaxID=341189 RepID=F8PMY3_SERL3|nr:uncharacterized protein SERLADRAFT_434562 [Serpula lacrymans var. lacrymans S7.9]EGO02965.1 hypothetical protein SERLA73DRAFT_70442 [Serpula lacrymans var. lacrymans S7.3]EGO28648.1 hypothetical protein SERLADRAFT_434562 [Serpula lacrymans var. lacrymans S7.9]
MPANSRNQNLRRISDSKPYTKRVPSIAPSSPAMSESQESVVSPLISSQEFTSKPGFPTYPQYKRIELTYLSCLSPRKRDKALITQVMFDKIWDVLHQPEACDIETPQFRFWVRKMFTLSRPQRKLRQPGSTEDSEDLPAVVLHENRPVAVMEQLYEVFCYCHERANHGGRDKTCAVIRQHYSWVPKELTAQFVKACPTCTLKRSGNPDLVAMVQEQVLNQEENSNRRFPPAPTVEDSCQWTSQNNWPPGGGPLDTPNKMNDCSKELLYPGLPSLSCVPSLSALSTSSYGGSQGLQSHPMSREVSLFNGIPHGWTHLPPPPAEGTCYVVNHPMVDPSKRPRVPNVVYTHNIGRNDSTDGSDIYGDSREVSPKLPALAHVLTDRKSDNHVVLNQPQLGNANDSLPSSLQHLQLSNPVTAAVEYGPYIGQIDPALLIRQGAETTGNTKNNTGSNHYVDSYESEHQEWADFAISKSSSVEVSPQTPVRLKRRLTRTAAPSSLNLNIVTRDDHDFSNYRSHVVPRINTPPSPSSEMTSSITPFPVNLGKVTNTADNLKLDDQAGVQNVVDAGET